MAVTQPATILIPERRYRTLTFQEQRILMERHLLPVKQ